MGLSDKAEAVKDVQESKEAKGGEGVERTVAEAHSDKALGAIVDKKTSDFINQKTNIDTVKVGQETVSLNDGKHETEKGRIKDAAKALASGDTESLQKAFAGLKPEQLATVIVALDKALAPGARVKYDADNEPPTVNLETKPDTKLMVPTDGKSSAQVGSGETPYGEGSEASGKNLQKVMEKAQQGDADRKAIAGLTSDRGGMSAAPVKMDSSFANKMEAAPVKMDAAPVFKDVPPPPDIKVYSGKELSSKDLADEGIKCKRDPGVGLTEADFDNGIKVTAQGPSDSTSMREGGRKVEVHTDALVTVEAPKDLQPTKEVHEKDGSTMVYDKHGHPMAEKHEDGSARVWTDKGVYNVYPDGHVTKETAVKNHDGTWKIIDDKNPLNQDMKKQMDKV